MWSARKVYGLQTRASGSAGREADGGNSGPRVSRNRRSASRPAAGDFHYTVDRDGHSLQAAGNRSAGTVRSRAENVPAHGRGADFKCRGRPATEPAAGNARSGSGCAFVWRNKERADGSGSRGVLSSGAGRGLLVRAQAGDATGVEDALHVGADGGVADQ